MSVLMMFTFSAWFTALVYPANPTPEMLNTLRVLSGASMTLFFTLQGLAQ